MDDDSSYDDEDNDDNVSVSAADDFIQSR